MSAWRNGVPLGDPVTLDRGLEFGDGLFETIKVVDGRLRLLDRHLARLREGCLRLAITPPDEALLRRELTQAAEVPGTGVVKLIYTRGLGGSGYRATPESAPQRYITAQPARERPSQYATAGVATPVLSTRLAEQPLLAGLKHLNRLEQVLARAELSDQAPEGLMLDMTGRVIAGTMSNLFLIIDGEIVTPALVRCGIAGVTRAALLDVWHDVGVAVRIRDVERGELARVEEAFLTNALIGVWPINRLDGRPLAPGPRALEARGWIDRW